MWPIIQKRTQINLSGTFFIFFDYHGFKAKFSEHFLISEQMHFRSLYEDCGIDLKKKNNNGQCHHCSGVF